MMAVVMYRLAIGFYGLAVRVLSLINPKARLLAQGRKRAFADAHAGMANGHGARVAWFHCASLGEFEQGRPLIEAFRQRHPDMKVVLTFFSPSGYEVRKDYAHADVVLYLPADTPGNARRFVQVLQPAVAFFVKYEYWYFYLKTLAAQGVPVFSVSSIFRAQQPFFKWYGGLHRTMLSYFARFFVQNEHSQQLLEGLGHQQVTVSGDTRFDRVWQLCQQAASNDWAAAFKAGQLVIVVGSSWPEDMEVLVPLINELTQVKFIIAPHEIHDSQLKAIEEDLDRPAIRYSACQEATHVAQHQVLIIDNIGMLSSLYQYGELAYIGGAFGKGLHNILEAATFGLPVFFGNRNYAKFKEANDLIEADCAMAVGNTAELSQRVHKLVYDEALRHELSRRCQAYIEAQRGATETIMDSVHEEVPFLS